MTSATRRLSLHLSVEDKSRELIKEQRCENLAKRLVFRNLPSVNNPRSIHGIYPYRGKISAIDAQQIIQQLPKKATLLDPFCGSGTILYEARRHGMKVYGVEMNPLAVTLARGKIEISEQSRVIEQAKWIIKAAQKSGSLKSMPESSLRYFHRRTADEIMNCVPFLSHMSNYLKSAFYGAICLAARGCNHYKWTSNAVGKIMEPKRYVNFYEKFLLKVERHLYPLRHNGGEVFCGDARRLSSLLPNHEIDYVFTSPPYFDCLDYTSYYAKIIFDILGIDRGQIRQSLIQSFSTYESDMRKVLDELEKVTSDKAKIIFVVGDKKTPLQLISGADFFTEISKRKPAYVVERTYTGTSSQIWDSINKTTRREQIIVWDKAV